MDNNNIYTCCKCSSDKGLPPSYYYNNYSLCQECWDKEVPLHGECFICNHTDYLFKHNNTLICNKCNDIEESIIYNNKINQCKCCEKTNNSSNILENIITLDNEFHKVSYETKHYFYINTKEMNIAEYEMNEMMKEECDKHIYGKSHMYLCTECFLIGLFSSIEEEDRLPCLRRDTIWFTLKRDKSNRERILNNNIEIIKKFNIPSKYNVTYYGPEKIKHLEDDTYIIDTSKTGP